MAENSTKKPRIAAIEYMRGIAMLGVIAIHVGSQYLVENTTPNAAVTAFYEVATRFSVPIFFFISAFGLFYNLDLKEKFSYSSFMKRRFKTVLVPYIVWSLFYLLLYGFCYGDMRGLLNPLHILYILFFGLACYQLYFMVILIWFYLLMPFWIWLVERCNLKVLAVLFILQMAFDYYSSFLMNPYGIGNHLLRDLFVYRLNYWVVHYLFIFVLGGYAAVHFAAFKAFLQRFSLSISCFFVFSLSLLIGYYYYCIYGDGYTLLEATNTAHQLCPAGIIYTLGATLFLFYAFIDWPWPNGAKKLFSLLGRHSYFIYLCHPVYLSLFSSLFAHGNIVLTAVHTTILYILVATSALVTAAFCRNLSSRYLPLFNELTIGVYKRRTR